MIEREKALDLDTRNRLFQEINNAPGLHFRELKRRTNLAIGSLQYHLNYLEKQHLIRSQKGARFTRYYPVGQGFEEQADIIGFLRQPKTKQIIFYLIKKKKATQKQISKAIELGSSTTSWYLKKLVQTGVASKEKKGRKSFFSLVDEQKVKNILIEHKKSFIDELTDRFSEVWEELEVTP